MRTAIGAIAAPGSLDSRVGWSGHAPSTIEKLTVNRYGGGDLHKDFPQFYRAAR